MIYRFHPDAEKEFVDAVEFYESREQGLGLDFANEVRSAIRRIIKHPHAWPVLQGDVHRCQTFRFP